jgi:hypothetical protein
MKLSRRFDFTCHLAFLTMALLAGSSLAAELPDQLPDPDGKEADIPTPVQVFILLGQSNMLGAGKIGPADNVRRRSKRPVFLTNWRQELRIGLFDSRSLRQTEAVTESRPVTTST